MVKKDGSRIHQSLGRFDNGGKMFDSDKNILDNETVTSLVVRDDALELPSPLTKTVVGYRYNDILSKFIMFFIMEMMLNQLSPLCMYVYDGYLCMSMMVIYTYLCCFVGGLSKLFKKINCKNRRRSFFGIFINKVNLILLVAPIYFAAESSTNSNTVTKQVSWEALGAMGMLKGNNILANKVTVDCKNIDTTKYNHIWFKFQYIINGEKKTTDTLKLKTNCKNDIQYQLEVRREVFLLLPGDDCYYSGPTKRILDCYLHHGERLKQISALYIKMSDDPKDPYFIHDDYNPPKQEDGHQNGTGNRIGNETIITIIIVIILLCIAGAGYLYWKKNTAEPEEPDHQLDEELDFGFDF